MSTSYKNPHVVKPHIYKKSKILNLSQLDEGTQYKDRSYYFSTTTGSLTAIVASTNNINQIVGHNWLKLSKLLAYFGLSKDTSEKFSKKGTPSIFNKFNSDFQEGGSNQQSLDKIEKILEKQNEEISKLKNSILEIEKKLKPTSDGEEKVLNALEKIEKGLNQVLGV